MVTDLQPGGIQFTKKHTPDAFLIILGILTLPLCFGLFFILAAFAGKDRVVYITTEQMREGLSGAIMSGSVSRPPQARG